MEPLASPIKIPIVTSPMVNRLLYGGHLLAAFIIFAAFPLSIYSGGAIIGVGVSLVIQHLDRVDLSARVDAILLRSNDRWSIITRHGEIVTARLAGSVFVSPWLVVLQLKPQGMRIVHIVLTRDNTQRQSLRRLIVRLRVPM
ncbi:MAG: hypothetical protein E2O35_09525 [Proteobacteria bacterium]|nr:MAG: hypothetical protein E2O35_09525 [Pseudomonadota bacterium]